MHLAKFFSSEIVIVAFSIFLAEYETAYFIASSLAQMIPVLISLLTLIHKSIPNYDHYSVCPHLLPDPKSFHIGLVVYFLFLFFM